MKCNLLVLVVVLAVVLPGCGSGGPKLRAITIAPNAADTTSSPQGQISFAATGMMSNNTTRALGSSNGLVWGSSNTTLGTINSNEVATCLTPGSVTITATAPDNLNKGSNAPAVSATATLSCS
jgi:hypothetical protein